MTGATAIASKRCLITGINGFAGTHLAEALVAAGHEVSGYTLPAPPGAFERGVDDTIRVFDGDIRDPEGLAAALSASGAEIVFHLAALAHVGESWERGRETLDVNVLGTQAVLDASARAQTDATVVVVSSGQVYGDVDEASMPLSEDRPLRPRSPYAASKLCAEVLARQAADAGHVRTVIVRPFNFAGPRQDPSFVCSDFARQVARAEVGLTEPQIRVGNLEAARDFTDVRDMVRGFASAAESGRTGAAYNLCSGAGTPIRSILDQLCALARTPIEVVIEPERLRPVDVPLFVGDARRADDELGWKPQIPLAQTLADTLDFWRALANAESRSRD